MKANIVILFATLLMVCCASQDGYVINGNLKNAGDGHVVISVMSSSNVQTILDTVEMNGGKFRFVGKTPFVAVCTLRVETKKMEMLDIIMVLENSPIEVQGDWANLDKNAEGNLFIRDMTIKGGKNTEVGNLLDEVYITTRKLPEFKDYDRLGKWIASLDESKELTEEDFLRADTLQALEDHYLDLVFEKQLRIMAAHPSLEAAAFYLTPMIDRMDLEEFERVFGSFDESVRNSEMLADIREELETRQRLAPGREAPVFTLEQLDGHSVSLVDLRGQVVLLDFWASWCGPCRASFPWVKEFYKKYHGKGVEILGISIDNDKTAWKKAVEVEGLPWLHVRDEKLPGGKRMASALYDVEGIPHFVLLDREGKLVASGHFDQEELEVLVDKLLNN